MSEMFSTADLRTLFDYVIGSSTQLTLDLIEPDYGPAVAHIGRDTCGLWTISPSDFGFVVSGTVGPLTLGRTTTWDRPVSSLSTALEIISNQALDIERHVSAISLLVAGQAADAVRDGGRVT